MRFIKIYISILACAFTMGDINAQVLPGYFDTLKLKQELIIDGNIEYFSSSIEKDIVSKFYKGGYITSEMKERSFNKHGGVNRFGGVGAADIEYRNYNIKLFKNKKSTKY